MSVDISERSFESAIGSALVGTATMGLPEGAPMVRETSAQYCGGERGVPGGYRQHRPEDYDRALCLLPQDALDFVLATQPKEWQRLKEHYWADVKARFLKRVSNEVGRRGALHVLRNGLRDSGCKLQREETTE